MQNFKSIHTTYGLQRMAAAEATGAAINITEIAVGDGNGNPIDVDLRIDAPGLVRERFRGPVNRVYQDPERQNKYTAELVIPASAAGFTLREIGIFDDQGGMFAVGNLPETYKPELAEGAFADTVVRFEFLVTNASIVTLQIDPNVAVATQSWIANNVTMASLLPGGTTGQLAKKASNADGDIVWGDPDDINVTVNTIDEEQTLAENQVNVDLALVTTRGLAVYVAGIRLYEGAGADRWQKAAVPNDVTRIVLGKSYPAGTRIIAAQNEPTGFAPAPLERSRNLSDIESAAQARANLDVFSRAETRQMSPSGQLAFFARPTAPAGWLKANGAAVSRVAYADLFSAIGVTFGAGDGFNTFNLPDLRGEFLRAWDDTRGVDTGRGFGTWQGDELRSHAHTGYTSPSGAHNHQVRSGLRTPGSVDSWGDESEPRNIINFGESGNHDKVTSTSGNHGHSVTTYNTGGPETRPRNRAMLACIKF